MRVHLRELPRLMRDRLYIDRQQLFRVLWGLPFMQRVLGCLREQL